MVKLITGGSGFIGSHIARKLVENGQKVVLFDIAPHSRLIDDIITKEQVKEVQGASTSCRQKP